MEESKGRSAYHKAYHSTYYRSKRKKPIMNAAQRRQAHNEAQIRYLTKKHPMPIVTYTDQSPMPMGTYKGQKLANVPAAHLLWYLDQTWFDQTSPLGRYIIDNKKALETENKNQKRNDDFLKR